MWGIRAIRVGVFLSGLLATIAGSGCCESCQHLWKGDTSRSKSAPQPSGQTNGMNGADESQIIRERLHPGPGWDPNKPDDAKPTHLTPERIHGGIY